MPLIALSALLLIPLGSLYRRSFDQEDAVTNIETDSFALVPVGHSHVVDEADVSEITSEVFAVLCTLALLACLWRYRPAIPSPSALVSAPLGSAGNVRIGRGSLIAPKVPESAEALVESLLATVKQCLELVNRYRQANKDLKVENMTLKAELVEAQSKPQPAPSPSNSEDEAWEKLKAKIAKIQEKVAEARALAKVELQ